MSRIVIKFGGSNLKQKKDIQKVIRIIKEYDSPVIIVSALYGLTDELLGLLSIQKSENDQYVQFINRLSGNCSAILYDNITNESRVLVSVGQLQVLMEQLGGLLSQWHSTKENRIGLSDHILSFGERVSSFLLSAILKAHEVKCEEALPEDIGLFTNGRFGSAKVDFTRSSRSLQKAFSTGTTYIIPGFYGISPERRVTLLGRGGSDYAAAAIAHCIHADFLDIWKDVDGFMSADPKDVGTPEKVSRLTYAEAAELAYFGAKILHPNTIEPLIKPQIPIRIFDFNRGDATHPSTYINGQVHQRDHVIKSITASDNFAILRLSSLSLGINPGIIARTSAALDHAGINIRSVITSQIEINILLTRADIHKAFKTVGDEFENTLIDITIDDNISVLATVGEGIKEKPGIAARIFNAVARKGINVQMITFGSSPVSAYFVIGREDKQHAIKEIHHEFFNFKTS